MSSSKQYTLALSWDDIDALQSATRNQIYALEEQSKQGPPSLTAEFDQLGAYLWDLVHTLGDARRVPEGEESYWNARDIACEHPEGALRHEPCAACEALEQQQAEQEGQQ